MKHTLNYLRELKWIFCDKKKIKPLNYPPHPIKLSIPNHKLKNNSFESWNSRNDDICKRHKLFYMCKFDL